MHNLKKEGTVPLINVGKNYLIGTKIFLVSMSHLPLVYSGWELNPHALAEQQILSLSCIPFHHPSIYNTTNIAIFLELVVIFCEKNSEKLNKIEKPQQIWGNVEVFLLWRRISLCVKIFRKVIGFFRFHFLLRSNLQ
jgi:hypothetical protein